MKVLMVDDQPLILKALQFTFDKIGYDSVGAVDGLQGKELFAQTNPAIAIIDLMLPFVTGLELIEYIRETEKKYTKIIVLSAMGKQDTIEHAFELGIDDYLKKPFMPSELVSRVKRLVKYNVGR